MKENTLTLINKAISESDLLFVNGTLVKPYSVEGDHLFYHDISIGKDEVCSLQFAEVESYE